MYISILYFRPNFSFFVRLFLLDSGGGVGAMHGQWATGYLHYLEDLLYITNINIISQHRGTTFNNVYKSK